MNVLFVFGALTHYFNYVLNELNSDEHFNISALIASDNKSKTVGKGVNKTTGDVKFNIIESKEYKTWYGKYFFKNFKNELVKNKIDIIIIGWPYILAFVFYPFLYSFCKKKNIKIIFREIPFQVPKKQDAYHFYSTVTKYNENCDAPIASKGIMTWIKAKLITIIRQNYYKKSNAFLTYTEKAFEILPSYGVDKSKITVYYNSPNTFELEKIYNKVISEPNILSPNPHRLIHVGRLVKWKRVDLIIEALSVLKESFPSVELVVLGGGPETENLQLLAQELNCIDNIKFIGAVYDPNLLGHYFHESSIYVLAGMGGLSINEAMAFAKPIVVSVCDGTEKHLVKNGFNGYYFTEYDVKDLVDKINKLFISPDDLKQFGENSLSVIRNDINSTKVLKAFKTCLLSMK